MKSSTKAQPSENGSATAIWTVGHSTRSIDEFKRILLTNDIKALVDVRSYPGSRRYPQFNKHELASLLVAAGISYFHWPELGGRRRPSPHSKNTAWKNASFRAYADHMETAEFEAGIKKLLELGREQQTAVMCAEALWWRCHRSLIADFLKARGVEVIHILDEKHTEVHPYTSAARIIAGRLSYEGLLVG
ncbi:MAG TPA: hypothetical protein DHU55_07335 [Blastocatellia bacterium]|nr:hypothetical protein [Blastocatellia bacterium]HAF25315.1 hypothetical protein [Blastocatellia bacterium]HCX29572.1 hypothetical protein [Blastocatellia bacterium]